MNIESILSAERTMCSLTASSKKRAIELAAEKIAPSIPDLESGVIYRHLIEREKLGSTAIGSGVALPHSRMPECDKITGALFVFDEPIDFAAYDDIPVSVLFVLLVPESETEEHLATLAMLAEKFDQEAFRNSLLRARTNQELYIAATQYDETDHLKSAGQQ